jgi:hypothetical protein
MFRKSAIPVLILVALTLTGCAVFRPHARATPMKVTGVYDAFYDGYYGQFIDGYWGRNGGFYYMNKDHKYRRDYGGHFRHDDAGGSFILVHGRGTPAR